MTQEALKLALEVNESMKDVLKQVNELIAENKALKEVLAQTQEPMAWVLEDVCKNQYIDGRPRKIWWECEKGVGTAFYTRSQRTWVGLTVEEIEAIGKSCEEKDGSIEVWGLFACAIEAKLKEKNSA